MRVWIIAIAALGLAACGNDPAPAPVPEETSEAAEAEAALEIDPAQIALSGGGLTVGAESFYFAAGQSEVETALAGALGKPGDSVDMPECGAGPMQSSTYSDSLTVNFQDGQLVGWFVRKGAGKVAFEGGLGIGSDQVEIAALGGFNKIEDSTLGAEFFSETVGIGGFIGEDGKVSELYAGTQCFFR